MTYLAHTEAYKGLTIKIYQDECAENPFTNWDCNPDIVTFLRRHDLTTRKEDSHITPEEFLDKAKRENYFIRPLHAYIHSGIWFSLSNESYPYNDAWDSGFAGFIFWTPEKLKKLGLTEEYINSVLHEGETRESWLETKLENSVNLLNDYASGNCWYYVTENSLGDTLDSCGGFFGDYDGYVLEQAKESADYYWKEEITKEKELIETTKKKIESLETDAIYLELITKTESIKNTTNLVREKIEQEKEKLSEAQERLESLES